MQEVNIFKPYQLQKMPFEIILPRLTPHFHTSGVLLEVNIIIGLHPKYSSQNDTLRYSWVSTWQPVHHCKVNTNVTTVIPKVDFDQVCHVIRIGLTDFSRGK